MEKLIVLAIGGNSLIIDPQHKSVESQYSACLQTCIHIAKIVEMGYKIVITHGNGPQVGFILRRSELSKHELHMVPLDSCGADTQGAIGYQIQKALGNVLRKKGITKEIVSVVTQVLVNREDPSFLNPTKPIGSFMGMEEAIKHKEADGWSIIEDAGRGYRRVVPSPKPHEILELNAIKNLLDNGFIVVGVGGGGIPVTKNDNDELIGVEAVIDKDLASCLLAKELKADYFIISTAVDKVYLYYGKPEERAISRMTIDQGKKYIDEGHFAKGSMLPKIEAIVDFVENTGGKAIVTDPPNLHKALLGEAGTVITT